MVLILFLILVIVYFIFTYYGIDLLLNILISYQAESRILDFLSINLEVSFFIGIYFYLKNRTVTNKYKNFPNTKLFFLFTILFFLSIPFILFLSVLMVFYGAIILSTFILFMRKYFFILR